MKTRIFLFAGLMAVCLASCTNSDEIASVNGRYVDDGKSIKVEVTDEFAEAATRADYSGFPATTFEEGDQIGVYAVNTSNAAVSSNVAFTRQSDGSWTPASAVVYNPDYKYYAYFPYKSSAPSFTPAGSGADGKFTNFLNSNTFWLADQSSKANFTTSNLMWAEGIVTGDRTVKFTMQHKRGLAIISDAVNQWYYTDDAGTKYNLTPVFSGNIPYNENGTRYFLLKPNTATTIAGLSLSAGAGKYKYSEGIKMTGTPSFNYKVYHYGSSTQFSTSKPSWLTITPTVAVGETTEFAITVTNSTSTTTSLGTVNLHTDVPGDAALKAASPVSDVDLSMVDNAGATRASRTTANCYLVHAPGTYKIPLVYGNAIKNGDETSTSSFYTTQTSNTLQRLVNHADEGITSPWIKTQLGSCPNGAQLIWQDVQGLISSVGIDSSDNGYLTFTVDADNIAEGNAVIAATLSGTIVWSWHIWVTTETLSSLTEIDTGSHTYQVAPVNIGQVKGKILSGATKYAGDLCKVTCTLNGVSMEFTVTAKDYINGGTVYNYPNPYYQWGRKDAMMPATGAYNMSGTAIRSYSYSNGTYATSASISTNIQNPDKWYNVSDKPHSGSAYNYWDMNQTSTGNIATATVKTIYDPCPPGFCVPTGNLWYYFGNGSPTGRTMSTWDSTNWGAIWNTNITGDELWFPASGQRNYSGDSVNNVRSYGYYWSASAYSTVRGQSMYLLSTYWGWINSQRSYGYSVRPVAEE